MLQRLRSMVRFTSRGWEGKRIVECDLGGDSHPLPWGFVDQATVRALLKSADDGGATEAAAAAGGLRWSSEQAGLLQEHARVSLADFKTGALSAYVFVAEALIPKAAEAAAAEEEDLDDFDMLRFDVTTPALGHFLNDVRRSWLLRRPHPVLPRLRQAGDDAADSIEVAVLSVDIAEGACQKQDQILGRWDYAEVLHGIRDSFEPEGRLPRELRAHQRGVDMRLALGPCRLVTEVQFTVRESFAFAAVTPDGGAQQPVAMPAPSAHVHVWRFEADIPNPNSSLEQHAQLVPKWRVANINESIKPAGHHQ